MSDKLKTILYATDLGDHMRPVFRQAIALAQASDARIVMLHVVEPLGSTGQAVVDTYLLPEQRKHIEHDGLQTIIDNMKVRIANFCKDETDTFPEDCNLVSKVIVDSGTPWKEILAVASENNADMIVLGTSGIGRIGSHARRVTQHSEIPVLVVPNTT